MISFAVSPMVCPVVFQVAALDLMPGALCKSPCGCSRMLIDDDKIISDVQHFKIEEHVVIGA